MSGPPPPLVSTLSSAPTVSPTPQGGTAAVQSLQNPLSVRVSLLRKPELYMTSRCDADFTEDGDILHGAMGCVTAETPILDTASLPASKQKLLFAPMGGIHSNLVFPATTGTHHVGETFRAFFSFRNQSPSVTLQKLNCRIDIMAPTGQRTALWDKEVAKLQPSSNRDVRVETRLLDPGNYTLSVIATYLDALGESKRFSWSNVFEATRAVVEVARKVTLLPMRRNDATALMEAYRSASSNSAAASKGPTEAEGQLESDGTVVVAIPRARTRVAVSVTLRNATTSPLLLTNVRFIAKEGAFQLVNEAPQADQKLSFAHSYSGGGKDALEDAHFEPEDQRVFTFELVPYQAPPLSNNSTTGNVLSSSSLSQSVRSLPGAPAPLAAPPPASPLTFFSSGSGGVVVAKPSDLGHVEWEWRGRNGDDGIDLSSVLRLGRPIPTRDFEVLFAGVTSSSFDAAAATSSAAVVREATAVDHMVSCGEPCTLHMIVVNQTKQRREVALCISPVACMPYASYTGPCWQPLGVLEADDGYLTFDLSLFPLLPGSWPIAGLFEIRDARATHTVLWPVKSSATSAVNPPPLSASGAAAVSGGSSSLIGGGGSSAVGGSGGHSSLPSLLMPPMEPWPPKLCELLVL